MMKSERSQATNEKCRHLLLLDEFERIFQLPLFIVAVATPTSTHSYTHTKLILRCHTLFAFNICNKSNTKATKSNAEMLKWFLDLRKSITNNPSSNELTNCSVD